MIGQHFELIRDIQHEGLEIPAEALHTVSQLA
jgi:hypothetical protein